MKLLLSEPVKIRFQLPAEINLAPKNRTSQEEGLPPLPLGLDKRGQAPLPDLFYCLGVLNL